MLGRSHSVQLDISCRFDRAEPRVQQISKLMEVGGLIAVVPEETSAYPASGGKAILRDPSASLSTLRRERLTAVSGENAPRALWGIS